MSALPAIYSSRLSRWAQIYYQLIGVGNEKFRFLRQAAERFPNVGFLAVTDLTTFVADDGIYEQLLPKELCAWLKHEHEGEDDGTEGRAGTDRRPRLTDRVRQ